MGGAQGLPPPRRTRRAARRPPARDGCSRTALRGPGRKIGTPVSGWQQQLVSQTGVPGHAPSSNASSAAVSAGLSGANVHVHVAAARVSKHHPDGVSAPMLVLLPGSAIRWGRGAHRRTARQAPAHSPAPPRSGWLPRSPGRPPPRRSVRPAAAAGCSSAVFGRPPHGLPPHLPADTRVSCATVHRHHRNIPMQWRMRRVLLRYLSRSVKQSLSARNIGLAVRSPLAGSRSSSEANGLAARAAAEFSWAGSGSPAL